tara:strand:+ start:156 stop:515 length:360 start_codon:yes stop_codon:yes gene_type:complete
MQLITEHLQDCYACEETTHKPEANTDRFSLVHDVKCSKILGIIQEADQLLPMVVDDTLYGINTIRHRRFEVRHMPEASALFYWFSYACDRNTGDLYEVDLKGCFLDEDPKPVKFEDFWK